MRGSVLGLLTACLMLGGAAASHAGTSASPGAWAERVQIVYDAESRSVERRRVKVWDDHPQRNLDFVWEPAAGTQPAIAPDGTISGEGKLVWRVRGSASYDPRTVYSIYTGSLRDGRPDGKGRLTLRTGEVFDGHWVTGSFDGEGFRTDGRGNRFEGHFKAGQLDGQGRILSSTGVIFSGAFVAGIKHGTGTTRLAGGTTYTSQWSMGRELGGQRPDALADARVGGLLKAQAGDADKVEISTVANERIIVDQQDTSNVRYQHVVRDDDISIQPMEQMLLDAWNGDGSIPGYDSLFTDPDWAHSPAYVDLGFSTTDGSKVRVKSLELQMISSEAYRKPMLSVEEHAGCVGFRPDMTMLNHGWGGVKNATLNIKFSGYEENGPSTQTFSTPVPDFDPGADIDLEGILKQAGVDTEALKTARFTCPSYDEIEACSADTLGKLKLGELAPFATGGDRVTAMASGTFDYSWSDDAGNTYQQSEKVQFTVQLAAIEILEPILAEGGDGIGIAPEVMRFQRIDLPIDKYDYTIDVALRGNKNVSSSTTTLKLSSEMTSIHFFEPVLKLADGSERRGKAVTLYFMRPRPSTFVSQIQPQCYLVEPKPPGVEDDGSADGAGADGSGGGEESGQDAGGGGGGGNDNVNK